MTVKVQDKNGNKSDWVSCAKTTVTASTIPTAAVTGKYAFLEAGQPNRYYAAAQGGTAPYTYYFRLYKGNDVYQNSGWIADDNYRIDFTEAGTYTMTVKVQDKNGNKSDWVSCTRTTVTEAAAEPLSVSVTGRYTDLTVGKTNTWYADGEGGTAPYTFYYRLYKDGEIYHNSGWVADTEYDVSLDEPGDYVMHVKICDAQGNKSEFVAGGETTVEEEAALAAPTLSSVTAVSESEIRIKWKKVTGAVNYILYRSLKSSTGFEEIAVVPATSAATYTYTDTSLSPDTTYYYKVQACGNASEGELSASKSATTDEEPVDEITFSVNHAIEGDLLDKGAMRLINNNTLDENGDYPCSNWTIKSSEAWTVSASGATKWFELSATKGKAGTTKLKISVIDWTSTYQEAILTFKAGDNSYTVKIYQMADSYSECALGLSLSGWTPTYKAATKSVTVTKHGSRTFTVSVQAEQDGEDDAWLSVTKTSSKLTVSARANYGTVSRTGTVLVKCSCGQTHSLTVTQSAGAPAPTLQLTVGGSVYGPNDTYGPLANGGKDVLYVHASSTNAQRLFIQIEGANAECFDSNVTGQENDFAITIPKGLTPGTYTVTSTVTNSDVRNDTWSRKATTSFTLRVVSASGTYGSLNTAALRTQFPAGKYWCHKAGTANNAYSIMDTACTCPYRHGGSRQGSGAHPKTDGSCGCNSYHGIQCWGYANLITEKLFGSRADTWSKVSPGSADTTARREALDNVRPGDAIRYYYSGHTAVVLTVSETGFTVTDCNWTENCRIRWDASVSKDYILRNGNFWVWKHP